MITFGWYDLTVTKRRGCEAPALLLRLFLLLICPTVAQAPANSEVVIHPFRIWGLMQNQLEKADVYLGFTNGFFSGPRSQHFLELADCIEKNIGSEQAVVMIDKYYKDSPQRWNKPLGQELIAALIVKDGPCPNLDSWAK